MKVFKSKVYKPLLACGIMILLTSCSPNILTSTECIVSSEQETEHNCEFGITSNQYNCQWKLPNNEDLLNMADDTGM